MPTVSESIQATAAALNAFNAQQDQDVVDLVAEFKVLNDIITQLQNNPGQITSEDQVLLDQLQARSATFTQSLADLASANRPVVAPAQSVKR